MSTLKVNTVVDSSGGNATTVNGVTPSTHTVKGRNLIINGAMQVAQRGTSSTGSGFGTVDRFSISRGTVTATQSQESLASGDTPYSLGFRKYLRITNTGTTSATNSYIGTRHRIEAQNIAMSGWNYTSTSSDITISFWVRSSLAGTYYMNLRSDDGTAQNYTIPVVLSANTWTKIIKTVSGDSGITINNDNGIGLDVLMWVHLGTDYTTSSHTSNQWNTYSGTDQAPDYSQNWNNTSSATFDLTGVKLEVGSVATEFDNRSYGEELALCQRYYEKKVAGASYHMFGVGRAVAANRVDYKIDFVVSKRADGATASFSNLYSYSSAANAEVSSLSTSYFGKEGGLLSCVLNTSGMSVNIFATLLANNDATAFLAFDSEL